MVKECLSPPDSELLCASLSSLSPQGVHSLVAGHVHPKPDTNSAPVISMIQTVQSADALHHLHFQKVLEQFVLA